MRENETKGNWRNKIKLQCAICAQVTGLVRNKKHCGSVAFHLSKNRNTDFLGQINADRLGNAFRHSTGSNKS